MSEEKKDDQQSSEPEGVDAADVDEVRGHLSKSPDQEKLSDEQLDEAAGGGRTFSGDISSWDVSKVTDMSSTTKIDREGN